MDYTKEKCEKKIAKWTERLENCKIELEVDKWYKYNGHLSSGIRSIINFQGEEDGYGINYDNNWRESGMDTFTFRTHPEEWILATDEEVKDALVKEAKKRGFKTGVKFDNAYNDSIHPKNSGIIYNIKFANESNYGHCGLYSGNQWLFFKGNWANIIDEVKTPEYTMEELTDKLGFTFKIKK